MKSVNFEEHFVFGFEQDFGNNLSQNFFGLFSVDFKKIENGVETVRVGKRGLCQSWESWNQEIEKAPESYKVFERGGVFFKDIVHKLFHGLFTQDRAVKVSEVFFALNSIESIKGDFSQFMVNKVPINKLGAIFNSVKDFPEELEFIEFMKIVYVLEDFLKVFIGFKYVFLINLDTLKDIEEEMVGEIGLNYLINDLDGNISSDIEEGKLIIAIELLDGRDVIGLEDWKYQWNQLHYLNFLDVM